MPGPLDRRRSILVIGLGHPLLDDYLAFVAARAPANAWLAVAFDLKVFFTVVAKPQAEVTAADVFGFLAAQQPPGMAGGWCGWPMVRRAWRPGPAVRPGGCRACGACMRTCVPGRTPACTATRCREAWLPGGRVRGVAGAGCR